MRPAIWIGDVARALDVAHSDDERVKVAKMLGFDVQEHMHLDTSLPSENPPLPEIFSPHSAHEDVRADDVDDDWDPPQVGSEPTDVLAELPLLQPFQIERTATVQEPPEPLARPSAERVPLPHMPLLVPRWTSAIIRALLSRQVCEGEVDIPALVEILARGRPVTALPRRLVPTLRYGVQVLVDRGPGMQLFRRDQDAIVASIRAVVGSALVEVGYFSDAPQRGTGPGARWTRGAYTAPPKGRRILLLSDLGLGGPSRHVRRGTRQEWEEFADLVRHAGCDAVALSPYPAHRWAAWMPKVMPLVSWDRTSRPGRLGVTLP